MKFGRRRVFSDREVLELFADEPELLAIVDAVAETQQRRSSRRLRNAALVAAVAAVAVTLVALLPLGEEGDGLTEAARAAVGSGAVVHVISSRVDRDDQLVDLGTGTGRPTRIEVETFFDEERRRLRAVARREGVAVADVVGSTEVDSPAADVAALAFGRGYRAARARADDGGRADGAATLELQMAGEAYEVVIDGATHLPRRYRRVGSGVVWSVRTIGSRPVREGDFRVRLSPPRYVSGAVTASTAASSPVAAARLPGLVWAGTRVGSRRLTAVRVERLVKRGPAGAAVTVGVRLNYGGSILRGGVEVRQAGSPEPAYGFAEARRTLGFNPLPEPGMMALAAPEGAGVWTGQLEVGGMFVVVRGRDRASVISVARVLRTYR